MVVSNAPYTPALVTPTVVTTPLSIATEATTSPVPTRCTTHVANSLTRLFHDQLMLNFAAVWLVNEACASEPP